MPPLRLSALVIAAAGAVALGAGPARAQDAAAEALFRDGDRLMGEGKLVEACAAFEGSNRIEARAGTLIRLGDCREKNRQLASAWSAYADAAARAKDPVKKELALGKVQALEPRLSRLTIVVAHPVATLAIARGGAAVDPALWGRAVPIDGGDHAIKATALGFVTWESIVTVPVERGEITVEVPPLADAPSTVAPPNPVVDPGLVTTVIAPSQDGGGGLTWQRKLAIGIAAGGVVVLGGAIYLGADAGSLEDEAGELCPQVRCLAANEANDLMARARTRANLANLGYGVSGAAVAAAAVLWYLGGSRGGAGERGVAVLPRLAPEAAGAALVGRF